MYEVRVAVQRGAGALAFATQHIASAADLRAVVGSALLGVRVCADGALLDKDMSTDEALLPFLFNWDSSNGIPHLVILTHPGGPPPRGRLGDVHWIARARQVWDLVTQDRVPASRVRSAVVCISRFHGKSSPVGCANTCIRDMFCWMMVLHCAVAANVHGESLGMCSTVA